MKTYVLVFSWHLYVAFQKYLGLMRIRRFECSFLAAGKKAALRFKRATTGGKVTANAPEAI